MVRGGSGRKINTCAMLHNFLGSYIMFLCLNVLPLFKGTGPRVARQIVLYVAISHTPVPLIPNLFITLGVLRV